MKKCIRNLGFEVFHDNFSVSESENFPDPGNVELNLNLVERDGPNSERVEKYISLFDIDEDSLEILLESGLCVGFERDGARARFVKELCAEMICLGVGGGGGLVGDVGEKSGVEKIAGAD